MPTTAAVAKAQRMLDQIKDGKSVFTRSATGTWYVIGPAADIRPGVIVRATKADGTTSAVIVGTIASADTKQGTAFAMATFRNAPAARPAATNAHATDEQIDLILDLLARRARTGEGGGFMTVTNPTRENLANLTYADASAYITSLKGEY